MHESAFCILTPDYGTGESFVHLSLESYCEEYTPDYINYDHDISKYEKIDLICQMKHIDYSVFYHAIEKFESELDNGITFEKYLTLPISGFSPTIVGYVQHIKYLHRDSFLKAFDVTFPNLIKRYSYYIRKNNYRYEGGIVKYNKSKRVYQLYYEYNSNALFDWYEIGGRWENCLKTLEGDKVSSCYLNEVDWSAGNNDYDNFCFGSNNLPETIFVNGQLRWYDEDSFKHLLRDCPEGTTIDIIDYHS